MQRRVLPFIVLGILLCAAVPAQAVIHVTFGNHIMGQTDSKVFSVLISTDAAEEIAAADLYLQNGDGVTNVAGPYTTAVDMNGAGTVGAAVSTTVQPYGDPYDVFPGSTGLETAYAIFCNATTGANADFPASGVLAFVTWETNNAALGDYPIGLSSNDLGDTLVAKVTGLLNINDEYFIHPGTITVTPEPSSVVMSLFAAAGVAAVAVRRYRRRKAA
jgi:MYXO-CTERM domain-containing protein